MHLQYEKWDGVATKKGRRDSKERILANMYKILQLSIVCTLMTWKEGEDGEKLEKEGHVGEGL